MAGRISGPLLKSNLLRNGIDLRFENDLLYFDVTNNNITVKGTAQPDYDLKVVGTTSANNLISPSITVDNNLTINNSNINSQVGALNFNALDAVVSQDIETSEFLIKDNQITVTSQDSNLEISPTGSLQISNLLVEGNLHATGNITADGTIQFGSDNTDSIVFDAEIATDIIPDTHVAYSLGTEEKQWKTVYTNLVNGQSISTEIVLAGGLDFSKGRGNIYYVSTNGDDTSSGDKPYTPLRTIQGALDLVDASSAGPQVIFVYPGTYQEITPLIIPNNVSIIGNNIRNTIITPDSTSQSEDIFHLNGDTTVANLTIKDFYYDAVNNTGHAFRFAPNGITNARSPYIQNVSVITKGTTVSASDPNGFNSGDAGRGAWVDGAELSSLSFDASMLFHSVTFITPGVDAITMTNGVRVEWLNSFTYFANRGLYALRGTTGRTGQDGSTIMYGAEVRSIGSASVYGNYGAVADGQGTLMYLINHNFGYIGAGNDSSNDNSLVIKTNEVNEFNNGLIYFTSTDEIGTFRVGDSFFVNLDSGSTNINIDDLNFNTLTQLKITTNGSETVIGGNEVTTGDVRFSNNDIFTLSQELNIDSANTINFTDNVAMQKNLTVDGNATIGGTLIKFGDQTTDTVSFEMGFDQNINPNQTSTFDLGSNTKTWNNGYLSQLQSGDVNIFDNRISTLSSNADLELRSTNNVVFTDLRAEQNFNNSNTNLTNTQINENLLLNGSYNQTGDLSATTINIPKINVTQDFVGEDITINNNIVSTSLSNSNLELRAHGAGEVILPKVTAQLDLNVLGQTTFNSDIVSNTTITSNVYELPSMSITGSSVTVNDSNADLEIRAEGASVFINDDTKIDNNLIVNGTSNLLETTIIGNYNQTGNYTQTGNRVDQTLNIAGNLNSLSNVTLENISFTQGVIQTTQSNSDLELRANGSGEVILGNQTNIQGDLGVMGIGTFTNLTIQNAVSTEFFDTPDIDFQDNRIATTLSNSDLELRATGTVNVATNNVQLNNDLTVSGTANLQQISIGGNYVQTGNSSFSGNIIVDRQLTAGTIDFNSSLQLDEILIDDNFITTTSSNADLDLRANGSGEVIFENNLNISNNFTTNDIFADTVSISTSVSTEFFDTPDIDFQDNRITTTLSNSDLELQSTGGTINVATNNVQLNNNLTVGGNTNLQNTNINGSYLQTGNTTVVGNYIIPKTLTAGAIDFNSSLQLDEILIDDNFITTTSSNADLELRSIDSDVVIDDNLYIPNNFTVLGNTTFNNITIQGSINTEFFDTPDIDFQDNRITTTLSNSDLELRAYPGRSVNIPTNINIDNNLLSSQGTANLKDVTANTIYSFNGDRTQTGNFDLDGNIHVRGQLLSSTSPTTFDKLIVNLNTISNPTLNEDLVLQASGSGKVIFDAGNVPGNVSVQAFTTNTINLGTPLVNSYITTGDIVVHTNYIETTQADSNLILDATGVVDIDSNDVEISNNLTVNSNASIKNVTVNGNITQTGDISQTGNISVIGNVSTDILNLNNQLQLTDVLINDNVITTTSLNSDLIIKANNTSNILLNENVRVSNDVTANSVTVNNIILTGTADINNMFVPIDIEIFDNVITTLTSNSNLELRADGNGSVYIQNIRVDTSTISTLTDTTIISPNVDIDATAALELPKGTTYTGRPLLAGEFYDDIGDLRYDNINNLFEGYNLNNRVTISGLYSTDRNTYIDTPNNTLEFTTGGNITLTLDTTTGLTTNNLLVGDTLISGTTLSTDTEFALIANGTGTVNINDITFGENGTDIAFLQDLELYNSGNGYVKFGDQNALRIPIGNSQQRPTSNIPIGTTRFNTTTQVLEVYDGTAWIEATGASGQSTSESDMQELLDLYTLVFA